MVEAWRSYSASKAETSPRATAGNNAVLGTELIECALELRARLRFGFGGVRLPFLGELDVRADPHPARLTRSGEPVGAAGALVALAVARGSTVPEALVLHVLS